jgi:peroxin-5
VCVTVVSSRQTIVQSQLDRISSESMADCGATGTVLDRTVRAFIAPGSHVGTTSSGSHHVVRAAQQAAASLVGHGVMSSVSTLQPSSPMPESCPEYLELGRDFRMMSQVSQTVDRPFVNVPFVHHAPVQVGRPSLQQQYMPPVQMAADPYRHHQLLLQQQQQQMMIMAQQQQFHQMMQMQAAISQQQQQPRTATEIEKQPLSVSGHSGIVSPVNFEDLAAAWAEANNGADTADEIRYVSDAASREEGIVNPVSIEELASAWADAQAEYEELERASGALSAEEAAELVEQSTNLWSGSTIEDENTLISLTGQSVSGANSIMPYKFRNQALESENIPALRGEQDTGRQGPGPRDDGQDWVSEGLRQFGEGNISAAIRAFEMELQHHDPDNATAWSMLGQCHAENDMDRDAIACLEQAVDRDPYAPTALLALGVSYVNELNHARAIKTLRGWVQNNPALAGLELGEDLYGSEVSMPGGSEQEFDEVQRLLLRALDYVKSNSISDSDQTMSNVHEALGVVYNVSRDFDAAAESFRRALQYRPEDYQLWNKLGATLANGNRSDEAVPAYHRALLFRPRYARAWLNMAIAHSNLHQYDEAARCYLQTLTLNPSAVHCWSYLRIALSCSERWDLIPFAAAQDLEAFAQHYDFDLSLRAGGPTRLDP